MMESPLRRTCPIEDLKFFNEFEPSCADMERTSLVSSEVRGTGEHAAASLEGAWVEVSAGGQGSTGVG